MKSKIARMAAAAAILCGATSVSSHAAEMQEDPRDARRRLIDLSHTIEHGMITYKGLPPPVITDHLSREQSRANYAEGTEFQIGKIEMVANTGTYLDAPSHRFADGKDLSELDLGSVADLEAFVVDVSRTGERPVPRSRFEGLPLRGKAVLVHTGWDAHWRTERYFNGHPYLTADAAEFLRDAGVRLVGIDSFNIDDIADKRRPVHTTLLAAGIPVVEHLRGLGELPASGFRFSAVPVKVKGMGTFPVRAYATLPAPSSR
jgi:arylformamidase